MSSLSFLIALGTEVIVSVVGVMRGWQRCESVLKQLILPGFQPHPAALYSKMGLAFTVDYPANEFGPLQTTGFVCSPTPGPHYGGRRFTFLRFRCFDCGPACMWTQGRTKLSEGVRFQSYFQRAVARRFFSQVNRDMEAARWYSSLALGWIFV